MKDLLKVLKVALPIGLAVFLMWYTFRDAETRAELFSAIGEAHFIWLFISVIIAVVSHVLRARRWSYLLHPLGYETRFLNAFYSVMIGYFVNMLLPRAGEVSRAEYFRRYEKIPFDRTFGTIAAERVIDLMAFGIMAGVMVLTQFDIIWIGLEEVIAQNRASAEPTAYWKYILAAVVLIIGVVVIVRFGLWAKVKAFIKGILEGLTTIWTTKEKWPFIRDTLLIWVCYLAMFAICYRCFDESTTLGGGAVIAGFVFGTLAVILTPGGTGAYHFAVAFALGFYGLEERIGLALGLLLWGSQLVLYIVVGMISLLLIGPYNKDYQGHVAYSGQ